MKNKKDGKSHIKKTNNKKTNNKEITKEKIKKQQEKNKIQKRKTKKPEVKKTECKSKKQNNKFKKKQKKTKKTILIICLCVVLSILILGLIYFINTERNEKIRLDYIRKENELISEITNHYNDFVKTNKETELYNDKEEIVGKIASNIELSLEETIIDKNTKYFRLKDFQNLYIKYQDVKAIETLSEIDERYKNYIVFNQNVITSDKTVFYDSNDNLVYEFNQSFNLPIIIKEEDKYGVELNNRLLYVKNDNIREIKDTHNTDINNASGVAVLNYHFFYDEQNAQESRECNESICHSKSQFKTHLEYFKTNDILTLRMSELEMYIDGKIQLPKSILITIDDGGRTEHAISMLTEYKMNATIFLITSWFDESTYYKTEFIELHSHSHNLHDVGVCPGGQGGAIKCLDRQTLLNDLSKSREELNNSTAFCYPFYEFNQYSIDVLKEAGFTMAFAGELGDMITKVGINKFKIPRFVIAKHTTIDDINNYFNQIKN